MNDTIFAPATGAARAAVAVVRLSGPGSGAALDALAGRRPKPRRAALRRLRGADGGLLDEALVLWFPGPGSYTGEDSAELHLHGGPGVVAGVCDTLAALGLRLAEPGEFTRRAFEHGKLDLAQAEAVADLIDAETAAQTRQALDQLGGGLGRRHEAWRAALVEILALFEAAVDFPDEDLPETLAAQAQPRIEALAVELDDALRDAERGRRVREGFRIALIGAPNAGKSSLLNGLLGRDAAIVTAAPGTTRDVIEAPMIVAGHKVILADMAGLRVATDPIEAEGVRRARAWALDADLRLWVIDGSAGEGAWALAADLAQPGDIALLNKADLAQGSDAAEATGAAQSAGAQVLSLSAKGEIGGLVAVLETKVAAALSGDEFPAATRRRHASHLTEARNRLRRATAHATEPELAAEDVRAAAMALSRITGRIDPESVLDRIFSSFCIGK